MKNFLKISKQITDKFNQFSPGAKRALVQGELEQYLKYKKLFVS